MSVTSPPHEASVQPKADANRCSGVAMVQRPAVTKRLRALALALFVLAVLASATHLVARDFFDMIPTGSSGQPRSRAIPMDWAPRWELTAFLCLTQLLLIAAPWRPVIGIVTFVGVSYLFRVHSTSWIYTQAVGLQTATAVLALCGVLMSLDSPLQALRRLNHGFFKCLCALVFWALVCAGAAAFSGEGYMPALQFSPSRLIQALALCAGLLLLANPTRLLTVLAIALVSTLLLRVAFLDPLQHRDAGIASDVVLAIPLLGYLFVVCDRWWAKAMLLAVGIGFAWIVFHVENRGAAIALAVGLLTAWATSKRRTMLTVLGLPLALGTIFAFAQTSFGERLLDIDQWTNDKRPRLFAEGVAMGFDHPVFGVGPGNFVNRIGSYATSLEHYTSHNVFVTVFAECGLPGLVAFFFCMSFAVWLGMQNWRREHSHASRWALVTLSTATAIGLFLTTTMFVLPYMVMAIAAERAESRADVV
ncbi:MAG: O-antigen ligase family protein [Planctomycetota bacterium]